MQTDTEVAGLNEGLWAEITRRDRLNHHLPEIIADESARRDR